MTTRRKPAATQKGKPLVEVLSEVTAPSGSLLETARMIADVVQDLRLGLNDDSDDGNCLIDRATDRLEAYGHTLRMLAGKPKKD